MDRSRQLVAGKLFVMGGAFDTITGARFPLVHRMIHVVLIAEVGPADRNRDLVLGIRLLDEDGNDTGVQTQGKLRVGSPSSLPAGASSSVPMVGAFLNVTFPKPGGYVFIVEHDDTELARIPFRVRERGGS